MKTLTEKMKYNSEQKTDFAGGYCMGVRDYQSYVKSSEKDRRALKDIADTMKSIAKMGEDIGKGYMYGIRDAANERKAKKK